MIVELTCLPRPKCPHPAGPEVIDIVSPNALASGSQASTNCLRTPACYVASAEGGASWAVCSQAAAWEQVLSSAIR